MFDKMFNNKKKSLKEISEHIDSYFQNNNTDHKKAIISFISDEVEDHTLTVTSGTRGNICVTLSNGLLGIYQDEDLGKEFVIALAAINDYTKGVLVKKIISLSDNHDTDDDEDNEYEEETEEVMETEDAEKPEDSEEQHDYSPERFNRLARKFAYDLGVVDKGNNGLVISYKIPERISRTALVFAAGDKTMTNILGGVAFETIRDEKFKAETFCDQKEIDLIKLALEKMRDMCSMEKE